MIDLRIASSDLRSLRESLLEHEHERCAVLLAARGHCSNGRELMLARETVLPSRDDYTQSGFDHAQLRPDFVARVSKQARLQQLSLVFVHTHPGTSAPRFSPTDDRGEDELLAFLVRRRQGYRHAALVLSRGGISARLLGQYEHIRVVSIGEERIVEFDPEVNVIGDVDMYDRQVRAFGSDGQRLLQNLRVAVVGLGGTGSITVQQLVHLGVRRFTLVDPDKLELTNLNRVVGASKRDLGVSKPQVASRYIQEFAANAKVRQLNDDVIHASVARHLVDSDVIFCCTDSHGSRSVVQQVAYQYLIPCIDIGTTITTSAGKVTGIFGRVQQVGPDQPCLWCSNLLNSEEVRQDMMNDFERKADPYIQGASTPAPSVISINGTVVSVAVTMFLGLVTSIPVQSRYLLYNAGTSNLRPVRASAKEGCFICSRTGAFGRGDTQALFARKD